MPPRRLLGLAVALAGLLALLLMTPLGSLLRSLVSDSEHPVPSTQHAGHSVPGETPSKIDRLPPRPKPTVEETEALLETTILPEVHLEDLTLLECVSAINKLIQNAGVDRHDLRVLLSHRVARHPIGSEMRWRWTRQLRNVPISTVLQDVVGRRFLKYRTGEGTVEVGLWGDPGDEATASANIRAKLDQISIPMVYFNDTTVLEARDFIISRSMELDVTTLDPTLKGIWIVVRESPVEGAPPVGDRTLNWKARNISMADALDGITSRTGLKWEIDDFAIVVSRADPEKP